MEKSIPELKAEFLCIMCGGEKKNSFEIKKCKSLIQKGFCRTSYQNILFPLEPVLKMAKERNKGDFESMCAKVTKHASEKVVKAEVNLNY